MTTTFSNDPAPPRQLHIHNHPVAIDDLGDNVIAYFTDAPSFMALADSPSRASLKLLNMYLSIRERADKGTVDTERSGRFLVRTTPATHEKLARNAAQLDLSLNAYVCNILDRQEDSLAHNEFHAISNEHRTIIDHWTHARLKFNGANDIDGLVLEQHVGGDVAVTYHDEVVSADIFVTATDHTDRVSVKQSHRRVVSGEYDESLRFVDVDDLTDVFYHWLTATETKEND